MIGKQLKILINTEKMEIKDFALLVKIKPRTVYSWLDEKDEKNPRYETLVQIKQEYRQKTGKNINLDWLITGEGEIFLSTENKNKLDEKIEQKFKELLNKYGLTNIDK